MFSLAPAGEQTARLSRDPDAPFLPAASARPGDVTRANWRLFKVHPESDSRAKSVFSRQTGFKICARTDLCEPEDLLGSFLLGSFPLLQLLLADGGSRQRLLFDFGLQFLRRCSQGLQLGGRGLPLRLQGLSQRCALSGLNTRTRSVASSLAK